MKKILSLLSALIISSSSIATVVSCTTELDRIDKENQTKLEAEIRLQETFLSRLMFVATEVVTNPNDKDIKEYSEVKKWWDQGNLIETNLNENVSLQVIKKINEMLYQSLLDYGEAIKDLGSKEIIKQIDDLKKEVEQAKKDNSSRNNDLDNLTNEIKRLQLGTLKDLEKRIETLEEQVGALKIENILGLQTKLDYLEHLIEENNSWVDDRDDIEKRIDNVKSELNIKLEKATTEIQNEIDQLKKKQEGSIQDITIINQKISMIEDKLKNASTSTELKKEIEKLREDLNEVILEQIQPLKDRIKELDDKIPDFDVTKLSALAKDLESLRGLVTENNKKTELEISEVQAAFLELKGSITNDFDQRIKKLKDTQELEIKDIKGLKDQLEALRESIGTVDSKYDVELENLEKEIFDCVDSKLKSIFDRLGTLDANAKRDDKAIKDIQTDLENLIALVGIGTGDGETLLAKVDRLEKTIKELEQDNNELNELINALKGQINSRITQYVVSNATSMGYDKVLIKKFFNTNNANDGWKFDIRAMATIVLGSKGKEVYLKGGFILTKNEFDKSNSITKSQSNGISNSWNQTKMNVNFVFTRVDSNDLEILLPNWGDTQETGKGARVYSQAIIIWDSMYIN